jgi:hypothetical protein
MLKELLIDGQAKKQKLQDEKGARLKENNMKYIIGSNGELVIFTGGFTHQEIARKLGVEAESAGFITKDLKPYGESYSLGLSSKPEDQDWINSCLENY